MTLDDPVHIPLNHRKHAVIDAVDAPRIAPYRWHAQCRDGIWFAARGEWVGKGLGRSVRTIWMHRVILDAPPGVGVTHRNGDGLDNRKANLQFCTRQQRGAKRRRNSNNTSGYRGVSYDAHSGRWKGVLRHGGRYLSLGYFATPEEAARAYDAAAREAFGEFAYRNFPADGDESARDV